MKSVHEALAALRCELAAALREGVPLASGVRLEADKVTVSLELEATEQTAADGSSQIVFAVAGTKANTAGAAPPRTHTLTVAFRAAGGPHLHNGANPPADRTSVPSKPPPVELKTLLAQVLGTPGFDSAARASVFCEAMAELSDEQAASVVASLSSAATKIPTDALSKKARHVLLGIVRSGPLHSVDRGGEVLSAALRQAPLTEILKLLEREWRTQDDWLD